MISVTILTKNSRKYLPEVLGALKDFNEVVVYDNGSTDDTMEVAKSYKNVVVYQGAFKGFGPTHNAASDLAKNDWILSIDSDEVVTEEMAREVLGLQLDKGSVYTFPRHNYYRGKWIRWCGWYPDRIKRLYHRRATSFDDAQVHEAIKSDELNLVSLQSPLRHYSYDTTQDFIDKMQAYSTLFAEQNQGKKKSSPLKAVWRGFYSFFKSYVLQRGFLGGYEGFVISVYNGNTAFYKYLKLWENNKKSNAS